MSATPRAPMPVPGPIAQAVQGLVLGRLTWWMGWPFALLGAAGLAVTWTNLSTLIGYERLKAAATAESRARVSELYWEIAPIESLGPAIGGRKGPCSRLAFRLSYPSADGRSWSMSFRGDADTESVAPLTGFGFLEVPGLRFLVPRDYLARMKATQAELWPYAYDPKAPAGSKTAWHSEYDLFWRRLDHPLIREAFLWRHAETPQGIAVRYDPADPSRALPAALMQSEMPPALRWGVAIFVVGFLALWGLGFFAAGFASLAGGLSRRATAWTFLACVASTPLWAPHLVRLARFVGGETLLVEVLLREFTIQKFLGFRLPDPVAEPSNAETVRYDWVRSRHTAPLGRFALDRGGRTFATDDEAYRALADQLTAQTAALGDADVLVLLSELRKEEHDGAELTEPFLAALSALSTDADRHSSVRAAARAVLSQTLAGMDFDAAAFARGERLARVRELTRHPDPKVAERARSFVTDADRYERRTRRID